MKTSTKPCYVSDNHIMLITIIHVMQVTTTIIPYYISDNQKLQPHHVVLIKSFYANEHYIVHVKVTLMLDISCSIQ